jgi:hypothetical protein
MAQTGRPSSYTPEMGDYICERLIEGDSLRAICRDDDMPAPGTVLRWVANNPEFRIQYTRAREEQAETYADQIIAIADEERVTVKDDKGEEVQVVFDNVAVNRNRLRIDARKWVASKLKPKKYGDRITQEVPGADGAPLGTVPAIGESVDEREAARVYQATVGK